MQIDVEIIIIMEKISNWIDEFVGSSINVNFIELFEKLCEKFVEPEPNNIFLVKFIIGDKFNFNFDFDDYPDQSEQSEQFNQIKKLCEIRESQAKFRNDLIINYGCCIITGDNPIICEGAHIIPYSISKNFDVANGLLLNRCFHKMFDDYLFSINSDNQLEFSNKIFGMKGFGNYLILNGKKLFINPKSKEFLHIHYKKFLEKNIFN